MNDYLTFKKLITPKIIQVLFWGLCILVVMKSLQIMIGFDFLAGLFTMIFGPVAVRVLCELIILLFRIQKLLVEIRNKP